MSEYQKTKDKDNEALYKQARSKMVYAVNEDDYDEAVIMFKKLGDYRDSEALVSRCRKEKAALCEKRNTENVDWNLKYKELRFKKIKNIGLIVGVALLWAAALIILFTGGPSTPTM
ncbi:MAG: hypothetical protein IKU52_04830 [Clostridia bacterium]|nr:hypothetical protein [Clostridia bacterium]